MTNLLISGMLERNWWSAFWRIPVNFAVHMITSKSTISVALKRYGRMRNEVTTNQIGLRPWQHGTARRSWSVENAMMIYMLDATNVHFVTNRKTLESGVLGNPARSVRRGADAKAHANENSAAAHPTYRGAGMLLYHRKNWINLTNPQRWCVCSPRE